MTTPDRRADKPSGFDDFLTTAEIAMITRTSESTVRYWRFCGTGPRSFRVGKKVLYRRTDVQDWLAAKEQQDWTNAG